MLFIFISMLTMIQQLVLSLMVLVRSWIGPSGNGRAYFILMEEVRMFGKMIYPYE